MFLHGCTYISFKDNNSNPTNMIYVTISLY